MQPNFPIISGVDLGAWTTKISTLKDNKYFQILTNEANFRQTPSIVSFSNAERLIGEQALIKMKSNFKNSLRAPLRLLSVANKPSLFQQEKKYLTISHSQNQTPHLQFQVLTKSVCNDGKPIRFPIQQFVISLLQKVHQIIRANTNQLNTSSWLYISVPSYFGNAERKIIKSCAQIAGFTTAGLVDQWQAIAFEYQFFRIKQLQTETDTRAVVFIDFGYSKFSVHICQITKNSIQLIDQDILKCTGARNMDDYIVDFYVEMFSKQTGEDLRKNTKAMVKLYENVEAQRKKLSANHESIINIQCILSDHDLSYNMKREQMENIVMPILSELASAMQNIKARVQPYAKFHSVQIVGGASRMPFFQEIIKNIFGTEPSKKLNTSEAMARGVAIAGTARHGSIHHKIINVKRSIPYHIFACIHQLTNNGEHFEKKINKYDLQNRKKIWNRDQQIPCNSALQIANKNPVQVILFSEESIGHKVLGYYRFIGEDTLTFLIDNDYIIRARLSKKDKFQIYDMGDVLSPEMLVNLRENKKKLQEMDQQFINSYELRNSYESRIYETKSKISGIWDKYLENSEKQYLNQIISQCEQWLNQNSLPSCEQLTQRISSIDDFTAFVRQRTK